MGRPYRRSSGLGCLWVFIVMSGVGVAIALGLVFPVNSLGWWALPVFTSPILASMLIGWTILSGVDRRRVAGVRQRLVADGFAFDGAPSPQTQQSVFAPVAMLESWAWLRGGAARIDWVATMAVDGAWTRVFQHTHTTGSGKSLQVWVNTVVARSWGGTATGAVSAHRPRWSQRRALRSAGAQIMTGDQRFDRNWFILGDADAAKAFFTEPVRRLLADSPKHESWHLAPGWAACVIDAPLDADNLGAFRRRIDDALSRGVKAGGA